jgi:hypothetical protein
VAAALGAAWSVSLALSAPSAIPVLCGTPLRALWGSPDAFLEPPVTPLGVTVAWLAMLLAMMPPLLGEPLRHVWFSSLPARRPWAILLFAASYFAVWVLVAPALILLAWLLRGVADGAAPAFALCVALAWSCAPWTQRARNRCHRVCRIGAAGLRADGECIAYGMRFAGRCVTVCWPWMILPLLVETLHVVAMVGVALWMTLDRIAPPRRPSWQAPPVVDHLRSIARSRFA